MLIFFNYREGGFKLKQSAGKTIKEGFTTISFVARCSFNLKIQQKRYKKKNVLFAIKRIQDCNYAFTYILKTIDLETYVGLDIVQFLFRKYNLQDLYIIFCSSGTPFKSS